MFILLILLGAFCGTIASMIGVGSSMMLAPLLLYIIPLLTEVSFDIQTITSATLALTFFSTSMASIQYHRAKRIRYRYALALAFSGSVGSFLAGGFIAPYTNHFLMLLLFGCVAVFSLVFNLIPLKERKKEVVLPKVYKGLGIFILFWLGITTGIIGIGGMALFMPYMTYVLRYSLRETIAMTTFAGAMIALFGILGKTSAGVMDWKVAIFVAIGGMVGGYIGPVLGKLFPDRVLRYGMSMVLLSIIISVFLDIFSLME
jgi:uncharacterized membrane protein YfcA